MVQAGFKPPRPLLETNKTSPPGWYHLGGYVHAGPKPGGCTIVQVARQWFSGPGWRPAPPAPVSCSPGSGLLEKYSILRLEFSKGIADHLPLRRLLLLRRVLPWLLRWRPHIPQEHANGEGNAGQSHSGEGQLEQRE